MIMAVRTELSSRERTDTDCDGKVMTSCLGRETVLERPGVGQKQTMHNHELHATFKVRGQVGISRGLDASQTKTCQTMMN